MLCRVETMQKSASNLLGAGNSIDLGLTVKTEVFRLAVATAFF